MKKLESERKTTPGAAEREKVMEQQIWRLWSDIREGRLPMLNSDLACKRLRAIIDEAIAPERHGHKIDLATAQNRARAAEKKLTEARTEIKALKKEVLKLEAKNGNDEERVRKPRKAEMQGAAPDQLVDVPQA